MKQKEKDNLLLIIKKYKNVCISMNDLIYLTMDFYAKKTNTEWDIFKFNEEEENVEETKIYARFEQNNLYCLPIVKEGHFRISELIIPNTKINSEIENGWTINIPLELYSESLESIIKLKSFW